MKKTSKSTGGSRRRSARRRPSAVAEILAAIDRVAAERKLRWYLFGAQAVALYGIIRTSADVDITIEIPPKRVSAFIRDVIASGFVPRVPDVADFVKRTRVLPLECVKNGWPLDVVLAGPGLEERFLERARPLDIEGLRVPVIAPEDLVATKILAGRAKDLEDVRGILRLGRTSLDLHAIRTVLQAIEDALGQSDLSPMLDRLLREATAGAKGRTRRGESPRKK